MRLALTVWSIIAPTLAGVGVVVALVAGYTALAPLALAGVAGAVIALPVSLGGAKALKG